MRQLKLHTNPDAPLAEDLRLEPESVAETLRRARETHKQDLGRIADALCIRRPYLEAIEAGEFDKLPGLPYITGFLRSYAEFLGLDKEEIVERFKQEVAIGAERPELVLPEPVPEGRRPGALILLISLLLVAVAYGGWIYISGLEEGEGVLDPVIPDRLRSMVLQETEDPAARSDGEARVAPATPQPPASETGTASPTAPPPEPESPPVSETPSETPASPTRPADTTSAMVVRDEPLATAMPAPPPSAVPEREAEAQAQAQAQAGPTETAARAPEPLSEPVVATPREPENVPAPEAVAEPLDTTAPAPEIGPEIASEPSETTAAASEIAPKPSEVAASQPEVPPEPLPEAASVTAAPEPTAAPEATATEATATAPVVAEPPTAAIPDDPPPPPPAADASAPSAAPAAPIVHEAAPAPPLAPSAAGSAEATQTAALPYEHQPQAYGAAAGSSRVIVKATQDAWLQVRDAEEKLLLSRVLRAGDSYHAPDRQGLSMVTGNAGGIVIEVDGTRLPSLGTVGSVRRDIPLDPDSLKNLRAR